MIADLELMVNQNKMFSASKNSWQTLKQIYLDLLIENNL
jgi:hypothetical protein